VRVVGLDGRITTVAGDGTRGYAGDGGPAVAAQLAGPYAVSELPGGDLLIADEGNNRVVVFSEYGVFLQAFGVSKDQNFALVKPVQVAVDAAERVYVLEHSGPGRITVYDRNGKQLRRLTPQTVGAADARWKAITVDLTGRLFIADGANSNVTVLDWEKGVALRKFGSPGRGRGQFKHPRRRKGRERRLCQNQRDFKHVGQNAGDHPHPRG